MPLSTHSGVTLLILSYRKNCLFCTCVLFPWENSLRTKVKSKANAGQCNMQYKKLLKYCMTDSAKTFKYALLNHIYPFCFKLPYSYAFRWFCFCKVLLIFRAETLLSRRYYQGEFPTICLLVESASHILTEIKILQSPLQSQRIFDIYFLYPVFSQAYEVFI